MYKNSQYRLKNIIDPLESLVNNVLLRKAIWWYIYMCSILLFFLLLVIMIIYYSFVQQGRQAEYTDPLIITWFIVLMSMVISTFAYHNNNLNAKEYIKLCRYLSIKKLKRKGKNIYGWFENDIKTAAYIESFFFTYLFGSLKKYYKVKFFSPAHMDYTSQVNLFYLFNSSYEIDIELKSNFSSKPEIYTECPEINETVYEFIKNLDYFHWKIVFNKQCLKLIIIGGSWQGESFARNIENGMNMFKELVNKMKGKYPVSDWKDYKFHWDEKTWEFKLEKA